MSQAILRGSAPHLEQQGLLADGRLPYLMLNLPFACNYRCLKCCNRASLPLPRSTRDPLSLDELRALLDEAGKSDFRVLVIAGEGEPLLDKRLREIVEVAAANGLLPYIFTNGSLLTPQNVEFLARQRASLVISLDSIDPKLYARLYGGHAELSGVLENIDHCRGVYRDLHEETPSGRLVSLAINTVLTRLNVGEVDAIAQLCADDIVFVCNRPTCIGLAEENWNLLFGEEPDPSTEVDEVLARYERTNGPLGTASDGVWCSYMRNGVSIGYDGSVLACGYALDTAGSFGHHRDRPLRSVNSAVMEAVDEFYSQSGHSRCVLRHPQYHRWIRHLKAGCRNDPANPTKNAPLVPPV